MIYNYRSIRDELRDAGYKFESSSDTEVLIKAWHFWGPKSLDKLEGFFSFGLYDRNKKVLFLCRDKIGRNHSTGENGTEALCLHRAWMR